MTKLVLGPILRYVGETDATIWVEVNAACEVEILGRCASTFEVEGHHYALVYMTDLQPATRHEYSVHLDGDKVWPELDSSFPPSVIRTFDSHAKLRIAFGSCRVAMPHEPPFTLTHQKDAAHGFEIDALRALTFRMRAQPEEQWPHALLMLGDQIYADEVSPEIRAWISTRRDISQPPGEELADFEEFTQLYRDSWGQADIRWLLSTIPSMMIFDDHDVNDDWNISHGWVQDMRAKPWWQRRIVGAFMSYWVYQHLGNLSPAELHEDALFKQIDDARREDFGSRLRELAMRADKFPDSYRWSFHRDFGDVRLVVVDSRAGRMLASDRRDMLDENEWQWIESHVSGDFRHLLIGTSLPVFMGPGFHYLEAWNEAVCNGEWGSWFINIGERIRRKLDLEHWCAFGTSFRRMVALIRSVAAGERGRTPETITVLSGDVHHVYLAKVKFSGPALPSMVYQAVCSPFRNPLGVRDQRIMRAGWSVMVGKMARGLARMAGVRQPEVDWHLCHPEPWFDNQVATLELSDRQALLRFEKSLPAEDASPQLQQVFEHRLDKY
ncbi:alkaline phosphatase D family protein [Nitrosomonas supralitoralis]|uniref:Metallophosphatase n=1 Tax=Nitrosomonas supralitoralis TaxID=2116706 RepID=A0A2P7NRC8_9PROT|nr:alkaline phosphatase D family protein [Nitrosomonas supralitoralis]PSJ15989.1 metallophosphatase [Nitrosomonas supralitoralis]